MCAVVILTCLLMIMHNNYCIAFTAHNLTSIINVVSSVVPTTSGHLTVETMSFIPLVAGQGKIIHQP